jgi:hypothetical protein
MTEEWYGYYSEEHDEWSGHSIWETQDGKHVKITMVAKKGELCSYAWKDVVLVGRVSKRIVNNNHIGFRIINGHSVTWYEGP